MSIHRTLVNAFPDAHLGIAVATDRCSYQKRMRITVVLLLFSHCAGNGLFSYYLNEAIWEPLWALRASSLVDKPERRFLFHMSRTGASIFFLVQKFCIQQYQAHQTDAATHAMIAFIFLFHAAHDLALTPLILSYAVEILPCHLRARGFNTFNFAISLALIFSMSRMSPFIAPLSFALKDGSLTPAPSSQIVHTVWLAFEGVIVFNILETKNLSLGDRAAVGRRGGRRAVSASQRSTHFWWYRYGADPLNSAQALCAAG
ncbi:hypothetical protein FIBSPDRAFT_1053640 [Athelia psychrophila]|uniref:Major facilitator superfamily (MFS) profile domain-containing protein n=1 Tax=Athelia psychrophila TaxID=1759441 RepID=A0A167WLQ7_9AGAM|nr:hypothetical protein FIBSPDRAFT_1053640 [Fibularhizoctonia sp. CBS 109695]